MLRVSIVRVIMAMLARRRNLIDVLCNEHCLRVYLTVQGRDTNERKTTRQKNRKPMAPATNTNCFQGRRCCILLHDKHTLHHCLCANPVLEALVSATHLGEHTAGNGGKSKRKCVDIQLAT